MRTTKFLGALGLTALCFVPAACFAADGEASFDCRAAKTTIETMICASADLRQADKDLAEAYRQVLAVAPPFTRDRIKAEQRAWLRYRDDVLGRQIREQRPTEYTERHVRSELDRRRRYLVKRRKHLLAGEREKELSPQQAYALCDEGLRIVNMGKVRMNEVKFRQPSKEEERAISPDDVTAFEGIAVIKQADGKIWRLGKATIIGSASVTQIFDFDKAKRHGNLWEILSDQREVGDFASNHLLSIHGRPVVVHGNLSSGETNVEAISLFTGDGPRTLCKLLPNGKATIQTLDAEKPEPCRAVTDNKARFARWTTVPYSQVEEFKIVGVPPRDESPRGGVVAVADVDLDNDGVDERVGLLELDNSTGSGSPHWDWIVQIDQGDGASQKEIFKALRKVRWEALFPLLGPQNDVNIFNQGGRTYFFGQIDFQPGVFTMDGGKLQRVCRLDVLPQQEIVESYINW